MGFGDTQQAGRHETDSSGKDFTSHPYCSGLVICRQETKCSHPEGSKARRQLDMLLAGSVSVSLDCTTIKGCHVVFHVDPHEIRWRQVDPGGALAEPKPELLSTCVVDAL